MDRDRFDRLARIAGAASTRREALGLALGAALGLSAAPALAGPDAPAAAKKKCKPKCAAGQRCVKRQCVCDVGVACGPACCTDGEACDAGACVPCTIVSSDDPDAAGAALKALVEDPAGPSTIRVGPGFYRLQSTVPGAVGMITARRDVAIVACNAGETTLNCGTMQVQNICLQAISVPGSPIEVALSGIRVQGPGVEPLESHGIVAAGVSAWESATLRLEDVEIGGFVDGVLGWTGGIVSLEGGVRISGNGDGILNSGGPDAVACSGAANVVSGNDPNYDDCVCVPSPSSCGCGTVGPCLS